MKNGDEVRVRQYPGSVPSSLSALPPQHPWVEAKVDLVSGNQESLAVSAAEGLGTAEGFGFNTETGRQQLILMKDRGSFYRDIFSGIFWEVVEK